MVVIPSATLYITASCGYLGSKDIPAIIRRRPSKPALPSMREKFRFQSSLTLICAWNKYNGISQYLHTVSQLLCSSLRNFSRLSLDVETISSLGFTITMKPVPLVSPYAVPFQGVQTPLAWVVLY